MITKKEILKLVLFLIRSNDFPLLFKDYLLTSEVSLPSDRLTVREIGKIIFELWSKFNYEKSIEFSNLGAQESSKYIDFIKLKLNDQMKQNETLTRVEKSIENLLELNEIYLLFSTDDKLKIEKLKKIVSSLSNPD